MTRLCSTTNSDQTIAEPIRLTIDDAVSAKGATPTQRPLAMTIDDITETRYGTTQHMHWPVDEDTRRRLAAIITSDIRQQPEKSPAPPSRWLRW